MVIPEVVRLKLIIFKIDFLWYIVSILALLCCCFCGYILHILVPGMIFASYTGSATSLVFTALAVVIFTSATTKLTAATETKPVALKVAATWSLSPTITLVRLLEVWINLCAQLQHRLWRGLVRSRINEQVLDQICLNLMIQLSYWHAIVSI